MSTDQSLDVTTGNVTSSDGEWTVTEHGIILRNRDGSQQRMMLFGGGGDGWKIKQAAIAFAKDLAAARAEVLALRTACTTPEAIRAELYKLICEESAAKDQLIARMKDGVEAAVKMVRRIESPGLMSDRAESELRACFPSTTGTDQSHVP